MSKDVNADVCRDLAKAGRAWNDFNAALSVYQAKCARRDFAAAEDERIKLHVALDDFLDGHGAANKRLEEVGRESR